MHTIQQMLLDRVAQHTVLSVFLACGLTTTSAMAQRDGDRDRDRDERHWEVELAIYGQNDRFVDVTRRVERARQDGELDFLVTNDSLGGDPAPGVPKRLDVVFRMGDHRFGVSVPENGHLHNPAFIRRIVAASYHARDMEPHATCREACIDVTDRVRGHLHDGMLEIAVNNNEMGGDPVPNVPKRLTVRFLGGGEEREVSMDEGSVLRMPETPEGDPMVIREVREYRERHPGDHDRDRDRDHDRQ